MSFGGVLGRFQRITDEDARALDSDRLARLSTSLDLRRRLGADVEPLDLLFRLLESAMQVTSAERGFVLVRGGRLAPCRSGGRLFPRRPP